MVPNINKRGQSFAGVTAYLLFDKDSAETSERVGFTETSNIYTDDVAQASRFMAYIDMNREDLKENAAGRKASAGNVYHYSLSWKDGQEPDAEHMKKTAHDSVARLGLSDHQYYIVEHTDEDHRHVHVVVNLVDPVTGRIANTKGDYKTLDRWANEYEQEHGIVCENRAQKYEAWEAGKPAFDESLSKKQRAEIYKPLLNELYQRSDNGAAFKNAIGEHGLTLTQGKNKSFVVVDAYGDYYGLVRSLDKSIKAKDVNARFKDIDRENLPFTDDIAAHNKQALSKASDKPDNAEKEKAELVRLQEEKEQQEEARAARERKYKEIQDKIDKRLAERRAEHKIDELTDQKKEAQEQLAELSGFWSKHVFKRAQYAEAENHAFDMAKRLEDAEQRFKADIEYINRNRPRWLQKVELEKHGFNDEGRTGEAESESMKAEKENAVLNEAEQSPEAAERLADHVQAKTPQQRGKVDAVKAKARIRIKAKTTEKEQKEQDEKRMNDGKTSREKWEEIGTVIQAQEEAAKAEQATVKPEFNAEALEARKAALEEALYNQERDAEDMSRDLDQDNDLSR